MDCYQLATSLEPNLPHPFNNLGVAMLETGRLGDAAMCYVRAIELKPDLAEAHHNLGSALLLAGDFERGLPEYEWRTKVSRYASRRVLREPH